MKRALLGLMLLGAAACGDDDDNGGNPDAAPTADAGGGADANTAAVLERGRYLVENVMVCGDCHTPRLPTGAPDTTKILAGSLCFVDAMPPADNGMGCLHSRNITNHATGLANRSDAEIKAMILTGVRPGGTFLHPAMPYWLFSGLTDGDADAVVAFLRTVPGIDNQIPANEAPFASVPAATAPLPDADVPAAGGTGAVHDSAVRGRYLARLVCIDCHTAPSANPTDPKPINVAKAFQGGRLFEGFPSPPFPAGGIYTANLTPHATGLAGWTAADIVKVLKQGKDRQDMNVCPPMPVGPMGAFAGLTDADATDIANYIVNLPAGENMVPHACVAP